MDDVRNPAAETPPKPVWIACRATPDCPGNLAVMIFSRSNSPVGSVAIGSFEASQGGNWTRYKCQTCNRDFVIST